ncbi:MAG: Rossmann-like and DUF2520 domain-containing protein [Moorellales bacterium]
MTKPRVGIVGAGRVGGAIGLLLRDKGYPLCGVKNRTPTSTARAAELLGTVGFERAEELSRQAEVLFITVRDEAIGPVAEEIATAGGFHPRQVVIHTSGSQPAAVLAPAREAGARVLSLHPLQSCPTPEQGRQNLPQAVFSAEGDPEAYPVAEAIVADIGARLFHIDPAAKPLYHAAACVASNYLVTLLDLAQRLLTEAGLPKEMFPDAVYPLIRGTLENIAKLGIPEALTGPISRGDAGTVREHLRAMEGKLPDLLPLYGLLGWYTVKLAVRKGTIGPAEAAELERALGGMAGAKNC